MNTDEHGLRGKNLSDKKVIYLGIMNLKLSALFPVSDFENS